MNRYGPIFKVPKKPDAQTQPPESGRPVPTPKRLGRPPGKRSDPDYEQVTAYIRRDTHNRVKIALLEQRRNREFSDLLEELLTDWLRNIRKE